MVSIKEGENSLTSNVPKASTLARVLINSLPKSGTNLVASILACLTPFCFKKIPLNRNLRFHPLNFVWPRGPKCLVGVDQPQSVRLHTVRHVLRKLAPGSYTSGHIPYEDQVEKLLYALDIRTLMVLRDPRDVVVSQVYHVGKNKGHFLHDYYSRLPTDRDRLVAAICGVEDASHHTHARSIGDKLRMTLGWIEAKNAITFTFEELIGPEGGGSPAVQSESIQRIGRHIGLDLSPDEAADVGARAFGKGSTYRKGRIGAWRAHFDEELKMLFKREAPGVLVRMGYEESESW